MINLNDKPVLTFCIPSYNRADKIFKTVNEILSYSGADIEIVVLDNLSTDQTKSLLSVVSDSRFRFVENEINIGGPLNHTKVITLATGQYAFLLLDKDHISATAIPALINRLKQHPNVAFGYCGLNLSNDSPDVILEIGYPSLKRMAYQSSHPTGMFYRTDILKRLRVISRIFADGKKFPFYPDVINGEMATYGRSLIINLPAFFTETKEECASIPSFTYDVKDLFFSPQQRFKELIVYVEFIKDLRLSQWVYLKLVAVVYYRSIMNATFGYQSTMKDVFVCSHYNVEPRRVEWTEMFKTQLTFSKGFFSSKIGLSYMVKTVIILGSWILFAAKSIKALF